MDDIAKAAGISRQTVYAHFPSRDVLLGALVERATARVVAAIDAADLESGPAIDALVRFMEVGWQAFDTDPFLLQMASVPATPAEDRDRHMPILGRLADVVTRGQIAGDIDANMSVTWILSAVIALGHAAGEDVRTGRMTSDEAIDSLRRSIPKLVRAEPQRARRVSRR